MWTRVTLDSHFSVCLFDTCRRQIHSFQLPKSPSGMFFHAAQGVPHCTKLCYLGTGGVPRDPTHTLGSRGVPLLYCLSNMVLWDWGPNVDPGQQVLNLVQHSSISTPYFF